MCNVSCNKLRTILADKIHAVKKLTIQKAYIMKRVLVLFFHPRFEDSKANQRLVEHLSYLPDVTIKDMYELYPDFAIDVKAEQASLVANDIVLWMHPFYWYSCPPLMKQWIDLVLEAGWAFGQNGDQLKDKWITNVITAGGSIDVYQKEGKNRYTFQELLVPFDQTAYLCNMKYLPPFVVPAAPRLSNAELTQFASRLQEAIQLLQHADFDASKLLSISYLNELT